MSNQEKTGNGEYAFLENRTIHELEELLHIALRDPSADEAYLAALEAAILRRETRHPTGRLSDTDKAWDKFRSMYLAEDAEKFALSKEVEIPETVTPLNKSRQPRRPRRVRRALLIAAAVVVVMTLLMPPVLGYRNIFQMVAQWTDESFKFVPPAYGSPETAKENSNLKVVTPLMESLQAYDLPLSFAPKWFPEDRHLTEVQFSETELGDTYFTAIFVDENDERLIRFKLIRYSLSNSSFWEKDDGEVIEFVCGGITHYIIENNGLIGAHWYTDQYEAAVSGNITMDEVKAIIKSIYEG